MPKRKPFLPGQLVQLKSSGDRWCFLTDGGDAIATQFEIPPGCVLMVVSEYRPESILDGDSFKDWSIFLAGDQLVVAQWKYFVKVKT